MWRIYSGECVGYSYFPVFISILNGLFETRNQIIIKWSTIVRVSVVLKRTVKGILGTFRFEHENKVEYDYEFLISNQSHPLNPHSSLLLTSRSGVCRNKIDVASHHLNHANKIWKVILVLKSESSSYRLTFRQPERKSSFNFNRHHSPPD